MKKKDFDQFVIGLKKDQPPSSLGLEKAKKKWAKKVGQSLPKNYQLLVSYRRLIKSRSFKESPRLEKMLGAKPVRTWSGVAPVTVILKPNGCSGDCVYCPNQPGVPKSYLDDEPAVLRARKLDYNPFVQMKYRLEVFEKMGHSAQKVELIILGGTFSDYQKKYRKEFIRRCFEAANGRPAESLAKAQRQNEQAIHRIVGLTVETRPDSITLEELLFLRELGVTRVEIGVQSVYQDILKKINRPHGIKEVKQATYLLRQLGFKICYHLMPGLPGSMPAKDKKMFEVVFSKPEFKPDYLKIYPCVVIENTKLFNWWQAGEYQPVMDAELVELLAQVKQKLPRWVRINRLGRDIPLGNIEAGFRYSHLRQLVAKRMTELDWRCQCLRCREIRQDKFRAKKISLRKMVYSVTGGLEVFLEQVDDRDRLLAFLRLFLPSSSGTSSLRVLAGAAIVRELHTVGPALKIGSKDKNISQHQGLGKNLLEKAERVAAEHGFKKLAVIAGVGVRGYYRRQRYRLIQTYMVKKLN